MEIEEIVTAIEHDTIWVRGYAIHPVLDTVIILAFAALFGGIYFWKQRKQKKLLGDMNQWLSQLMHSIPDMGFIYNYKQELVEIINYQDNVTFDLPLDKICGMTIKEIGEYDPAFREAMVHISHYVGKTIETKETYNFRYKVYKNNRAFYARARTVPFQNKFVICFAHDDTEQILAEKEVERLNNFHRAILESLPISVMIKDIENEFRFSYRNNKLWEFFGEQVNLDTGKNVLENQVDEAWIYDKEDRKVAESGEALTIERVIKNQQSGLAERWAVTTKDCFTTKDGQKYLMGVTVETTDIRKREIELEQLRSALSMALEAGGASAWFYDIKRDEFHSLYGKTLGGSGMKLDVLESHLHPEEKGVLRSKIDNIIKGVSKKEKYVFRMGHEKPYQWLDAHMIGNYHDSKLNHIIGTERNVTAETNKQKDLEAAYTQFELAFEAADMSTWELDALTMKFSSTNANVVEAKGYTLSEHLQFIHKDDRWILEEKFEKLLRGVKDKTSMQLRLTLPENNNQERWYEIIGLVARKHAGKVSRLVGIRRDITSQKMTDELIELRNKAEQSNMLKSAFLANMSHEIRTPLNAIVGFSQIIIDSSSNKHELSEYIEIIESNNDLLLQLINDILDFSRIEAGEATLLYTEAPISPLFKQIQQMYRLKVQDGVRLEIELPEQPCAVVSDHKRLMQILSNFVHNASKYTSQGEIKAGYTYTDSGLRFYVKDTGKGIADENIPRVFDRFSKFDPFVQGGGLGLPICKSIVENLGGEIGVFSKEGVGSEFWFSIPCEYQIIEYGEA